MFGFHHLVALPLLHHRLVLSWHWFGRHCPLEPLPLPTASAPLHPVRWEGVCVCMWERENECWSFYVRVCVCVCIGGGGDDHTNIGSEVTDWFRLSTPHHDEKGSWGCEYPSSLLYSADPPRPTHIIMLHVCIHKLTHKSWVHNIGQHKQASYILNCFFFG